jgi:hypothetical protein
MQNHERVSFIKSLEIVTEAPSASTEASANVVNNQIIMFAAGLNQQHKVCASPMSQTLVANTDLERCSQLPITRSRGGVRQI